MSSAELRQHLVDHHEVSAAKANKYSIEYLEGYHVGQHMHDHHVNTDVHQLDHTHAELTWIKDVQP